MHGQTAVDLHSRELGRGSFTVDIQGRFLGLIAVAAAGFVLYLTWLLVRPLFTSSAPPEPKPPGMDSPARRRARHFSE